MKLNEDTFTLYAAKAYDNPSCSGVEEFNEDLKRFQYIKKLLNKYEKCGELKERLILNHIIILFNCFGTLAVPFLFMKLEGYHHLLKPFLVFLNKMPKHVSYNGIVIRESDIYMDEGIIHCLRNISNEKIS